MLQHRVDHKTKKTNRKLRRTKLIIQGEKISTRCQLFDDPLAPRPWSSFDTSEPLVRGSRRDPGSRSRCWYWVTQAAPETTYGLCQLPIYFNVVLSKTFEPSAGQHRAKWVSQMIHRKKLKRQPFEKPTYMWVCEFEFS
jgi:hypothetical protein